MQATRTYLELTSPGQFKSALGQFPNLVLDCSATRWMVREISARRDAAREFFIRNQGRILFGSDQVSGDDRGFDFLASRFWVHRKLWETAYVGPSPIFDPDLPEDQQPMIRGLALPDGVLQKLYHDNAIKFLAGVGAGGETSKSGRDGEHREHSVVLALHPSARFPALAVLLP